MVMGTSVVAAPSETPTVTMYVPAGTMARPDNRQVLGESVVEPVGVSVRSPSAGVIWLVPPLNFQKRMEALSADGSESTSVAVMVTAAIGSLYCTPD